MAFVEINNIKKHFGYGENKIEVLKGINLEIEKGEMCVLLGPSGSGKSTLLNIIGAIEYADDGYIAINGEKTKLMNEKQLTMYRRKHLGYVFQMYNLIPNLTVRENIEVIIRLILMNLWQHSALLTKQINCRHSFQAASSKELLSEEQ